MHSFSSLNHNNGKQEASGNICSPRSFTAYSIRCSRRPGVRLLQLVVSVWRSMLHALLVLRSRRMQVRSQMQEGKRVVWSLAPHPFVRRESFQALAVFLLILQTSKEYCKVLYVAYLLFIAKIQHVSKVVKFCLRVFV